MASDRGQAGCQDNACTSGRTGPRERRSISIPFVGLIPACASQLSSPVITKSNGKEGVSAICSVTSQVKALTGASGRCRQRGGKRVSPVRCISERGNRGTEFPQRRTTAPRPSLAAGRQQHPAQPRRPRPASPRPAPPPPRGSPAGPEPPPL